MPFILPSVVQNDRLRRCADFMQMNFIDYLEPPAWRPTIIGHFVYCIYAYTHEACREGIDGSKGSWQRCCIVGYMYFNPRQPHVKYELMLNAYIVVRP